MSTLLIIIFLVYGLGAGLFLTVVFGEAYSKRNPNSKFKLWWRKNIVGEYQNID